MTRKSLSLTNYIKADVKTWKLVFIPTEKSNIMHSNIYVCILKKTQNFRQQSWV